jgi:uncharacterized protein (TIGR00661 family)
MESIVYSLSGEGRGHATRVLSVVEHLRHNFRVTVLAPGQAYELLAPIYMHSDVEIIPIPGLRFHYKSNNRLDYLQSVVSGFGSLKEFPVQVNQIVKILEKCNPRLIITDFEPLLPRAAEQLGLDYISLDHQHFLTTYDLSSLNWNLQVRAKLMAQFIPLFYQKQSYSVVSSFYFPPWRKGLKNTLQVGTLLRPEVLELEPYHKNYYLVYVRRGADPRVMRVLESCGENLRIYGWGALPSRGNLRFFDAHPERFAMDLAGCKGLITTAGNQLIGEAAYLDKPVLAMPEPGNSEQEINAHFVAQGGLGLTAQFDSLDTKWLKDFFSYCERHQVFRFSTKVSGNEQTFKFLDEWLGVQDHGQIVTTKSVYTGLGV